MNLKRQILEFLYEQVQAKKIPHIRPQMVEDFEEFVEKLITQREADRMAERMMAKASKAESEEKAVPQDLQK